MHFNWIFLVTVVLFQTACTLDSRIYSTSSNFGAAAGSNSKITIIALADYVNSQNVDSFAVSGVCNGNESLSLTTPIVKVIACTSGTYSDTLNLTAVPDGNITFTISNEALSDSASVLKVKDATAPTPPSPINDGIAWIDLTSTPLISWTASTDAGSGLKKYRYSIGTAAGLSNVVAWTDTSAISVQLLSGLSLTLNSFYYVNIQAVDNYDNATSIVSSDGWRVVTSMSIAAKSSTAVNWNDYYKVATPTILCDGTETRRNCSHGGEKRVVNLADIPTCANLTMKDSLDVFYWRCDATSGNAVFESVMVKEGKGLKSLITSAGQWKKLQGILYQSNIPIRATAEAAWWTNTITPLPDNSSSSAMSLSSSGTIYYINSDQTTSGYYIAADKIAIVSLNNSNLNFSSGATENCSLSGAAGTDYATIICSNSRKFTWMEFDNSITSNYYYFSASDNFSTIINISSLSRLELSGNRFLLKNSSISELYTSSFISASIFENLNITGPNLNISNSSSNNIFNRLKGATQITLNEWIGSSFPSKAMAIESPTIAWYFGPRGTFNNIKATFFGLLGPDRTTVSNLFAYFLTASSSTLTKLTGLWLLPTIHTCTNAGSSDNGFSATCVLGGASNATKLNNIDPLLLKNITNDGTTQNQPFVPGSTCPSAVHGNKVAVNLETAPKTYLLNAYEITGDELGNDNLLCESNESCIYMPNIGSNQGSGDFYSNGTCSFQNGTVSTVLMYAYPNP